MSFTYDPIWGGPLMALAVAVAAAIWAHFSKRAFDRKYNRNRD
jgi:hypothetical protein